jgi:glycosyltransferase involved in cell wall biosynthesis
MNIKTTVIISYYKAIANLKLILKALEMQSEPNFEVILSEDDYNENTIAYVAKCKELFKFPITHIYQQEDNGFRKTQMLNRAILHAKTEKLVFIDGDCVPHRHFVKEYAQNIKENEPYYYSGRAVLLSENLTQKVMKAESLAMFGLFSLLSNRAEKVKEGIYFPLFPLSVKPRGIVGRNWGTTKKALLEINGFDEDYVFAGIGEDTDVEWRLIANGVKVKSMKNKAIVYHLYHLRGYSDENVRFNIEVMRKKQQENQVLCLNGIKKLAHTEF